MSSTAGRDVRGGYRMIAQNAGAREMLTEEMRKDKWLDQVEGRSS